MTLLASDQHPLDRRAWLARAAGLAGWAGGTATLSGWAFAAGAANATSAAASDDERPRLAVVMLRGALDSLAAVQPVGDGAWSALRPPGASANESPTLPLDGLFALHPGLPTLHAWWQDKQLLVAHAVATPYRERSHFDAQQMLESGGQRPFELPTGFIGRAMALTRSPGLALGANLPVALRGAETASSWSTGRARPMDDDLLDRVAALYGTEPHLQRAWALAREQRRGAMSGTLADAGGGAALPDLARQAGRWLASARGGAVAWIDSNGWDTHTQQSGRLARLLPQLDQALAQLRTALGGAWQHTTVLVLTEFGRSATLNGSGGTDHGTGMAAFVAGGRVAGGRVLADWPGVASHQLLDRRDLRPTRDLRTLLAPVVQRQFQLSDAQLDREVLPGVLALGPRVEVYA